MNTHFLVGGAYGLSLALACKFIPFSSMREKVRRRAASILRIEHICFFHKNTTDNSGRIHKALVPVDIVIPSEAEILPHQSELATRFRLPPALLLKRLAAGNRVILAKQDQRIIAMLWLAFDEQLVSEAGLMLGLRQNEFVTFNAVTLPEWRSQGISTALNQVAHDFCSKQGRTAQLTWRSMTNKSALRVAEKLGQASVGMTTCVWLLGRRVWLSHDHENGSAMQLFDHLRH